MAMVLSECGEPSVHAGNEEVKLTIRNVLVEHKVGEAIMGCYFAVRI